MHKVFLILIVAMVLLGGSGLWYIWSRFWHWECLSFFHEHEENFPDAKNGSFSEIDFFGTENIWRILWKLSPPVMLSELILALYNICDSCFVGHYSADGLTALSVIFPIQFMAIAFAVGTGIGVNTLTARLYALKRSTTANHTAAVGTLIAFILWAFFAIASVSFLAPYIKISTQSAGAAKESMTYGQIVCIGSLPLFLEGIWTKIHQARGNMKRPMYAQIAGAGTNILLDWLLIFGIGPIPEMGVAGAAYATVAGQTIAAGITAIGAFRRAPHRKIFLPLTRSIFLFGYPQILRYFTMTFYIVILNIILARFSDAAVTVLGLYYKMQAFFFIPFSAMLTCLVPVLSYNFTKNYFRRCRMLIKDAILVSCAFMLVGVFCFDCIPELTIRIFSSKPDVLKLGIPAFRIIGISLIPAVFSLTFPTIFQAIGSDKKSVFLSLMRQIFTLLPFFYLFSLISVDCTWIAFPAAESLTGLAGLILYLREKSVWRDFAHNRKT